MSRFQILALIFIVVVAGCSPKLERQGVPMSAGFRLDVRFLSEDSVRADLKRIQAAGIRSVTAEMLLEANAEGLPKVNRTALVQLSDLIPLLNERGLSLNLLFSQADFVPLFPTDSIGDPVAWFGKYKTELEEVLRRAKDISIGHIVLGSSYLAAEPYVSEWQALATWLRTKTTARLSYARFVSEVPKAQPMWGWVDEIGIAYEAPLDGNHKRAAREWHENVAETARRAGKPVFISGANIMMDGKFIQLQNRLRFWPDDVEVTGINLNNIFSESVFSDTTQYFAITHGSETYDWVVNYTDN